MDSNKSNYEPINLTNICVTDDRGGTYRSEIHYITFSVIPVFGIVSIILNGMVVLSTGLILTKRPEPRSTYLFLGNVALTDLVTAVGSIFAITGRCIIKNHYFCVFTKGLVASSIMASVYSVGLVAVDRFIYLTNGLLYPKYMYSKRAKLLILLVWAFGLTLGLIIPIIGLANDTKNGLSCWLPEILPKYYIRMLVLIVGIPPLLLVITLHLIILYRAIKKIVKNQKSVDAQTESSIQVSDNDLRMFKGRTEREPNEKQNKRLSLTVNAKLKAVMIVVLTMGSFCVFNAPYVISLGLHSFCYEQTQSVCQQLKVLISGPFVVVGYLNCLANPLIYAWWHKGFRNFFCVIVKSRQNSRK